MDIRAGVNAVDTTQEVGSWGDSTALSTFHPLEIFAAVGSGAGGEAAGALVYNK